MKKTIVIAILISTLLLFTGCKTADILKGNEIPDKDWELIEESANKSSLNIYLTYNDEDLKTWLNDKYSDVLKAEHDMSLTIKVLNYEDIEKTLENEKTTETADGSIDLLILRDDQFTQLKNMSYLYEDVTSKLPNYIGTINEFDLDVQAEHSTPLDDYAIPFGREQFVLMFDEDELEVFPQNTDELFIFLEENNETFSYANPLTDTTGAEFVRTVMYERVSEEDMMLLLNQEITEAEVEVIIQPGMDYLKSIDGLILKKEDQYFTRQSEIDEKFKEGMLYFSMSEDFAYVKDAIDDELYPDGAKSFMFEYGTISDTIYMAIPMNASNKSGALVAMNEMLSIDLQLHKYVPSNWGNLPVLDLNLLTEDQAEQFSKASVKRSTLRVEELAAARYQELPLNVQMMINNIWDRQINTK